MIFSQPFARFWSAINDQMASCGLPEIGFSAARGLWEQAISKAGSEARALSSRVEG